MNKHIQVIIGLSVFALMAKPVMAQSFPIAGESARPHFPIEITDSRITKLEAFLTAYNSPLAADAGHFVKEADRLGLDWRLVAAICGVESTFGKHIPANSYNGWGWGVFTGTNDGVHFSSWKDGITQVSEGLKYRYIDKGATSIDAMGKIYAASPTWSMKVKFFIEKIDAFMLTGIDHLAVTI